MSNTSATETCPNSLTARALARAAVAAECDAIRNQARVELEQQNRQRSAELEREKARAKASLRTTWTAALFAGVAALGAVLAVPFMSSNPTLSADGDSFMAQPQLEVAFAAARSDARAVKEVGPSATRGDRRNDRETTATETGPCNPDDPMAFCLRQ